MKFKFTKKKIPAVVILLACFVLLAVTSDFSHIATQAGTKPSTEKKTIIIDAGHGGLDGGCVGIHGELEKDINLAIVQDLSAMLKMSGFNVVLTRDSDVSIHNDGVTGTRNQKVSDMENRLKIVQKYGDGIFVSIHQNQFTQSQYFGAQMFYNNNNENNQLLAQLMQDNFKVLQPENNREIKLSGDELYLFKNTKIPSVLIECGFLSNENDATNLSDEGYQKKVAFTVYGGIIKYLQATADDESESENNSDVTSDETDSQQEGIITTNGKEQSSICLQ